MIGREQQEYATVSLLGKQPQIDRGRESDEVTETPLPILLQDTLRLQSGINDQLTISIIDGTISPVLLPRLRQDIQSLQNNKDEIRQWFSNENTEDTVDSVDTHQDDMLTLTASRLTFITSLVETQKQLQMYQIETTSEKDTYYIPPESGTMLQEAISLAPEKETLVGFTVNHNEQQDITLFFFQEGHIKRKIISLHERQNTINENRKSKKIIIAVEGDIAGHAIRALETAKGLRQLGYSPDIIGSGYYMQHFEQEGFVPIQPFAVKEDSERERVIQKARGEGKGGVFFWDYNMVNDRAKKYKEVIGTYMTTGIDLFLSDMNPIASIAAEHIQDEQSITFSSVTQTHDISLSAERTLRSLWLKNIPIGEIIHRMNTSPFINKLDPKNRRRIVTHILLNEVADTIMGLPLSTYDYLHRDRNHGSSTRKPRRKFTDYMYGRDGTLIFGLENDMASDHHVIGLQADTATAPEEQKNWDVIMDKKDYFVLNAQGSTYNKQAWEIVSDAVTSLPECFSIHATGRREDQPIPIYQQPAVPDEEPIGYTVGYVAGYHFSKKADLIFHHGGHGTISQWLLATADRIIDTRDQLTTMVSSNTDEEITQFVEGSKGTSRSFAICNTFEQENNALILNEMGGENVCTVLIANRVVKLPDPLEYMRVLTAKMLRKPLDEKERQFWIDTVKKVSMTNAPSHAALILESMMAHKAN